MSGRAANVQRWKAWARWARALLTLLVVALGGLWSGSVYAEPLSPAERDAHIESTVRQINALLAEHPRLGLDGFSHMTFVADGSVLMTLYGDPTVGADGPAWMADVYDLRGDVLEKVYDDPPPTRSMPCGDAGPLRPEHVQRCWVSEAVRGTINVYGPLWHTAEPIAARAIHDGVEALIRLMQARARAPR